MSTVTARPLFDGPIARRAIRDAFLKLNPLHLLRNPMTYVCSWLEVLLVADASA